MKNAEEALYIKIAADLREKISTGFYKPGQRLPAMRDFAKAQQVSMGTVRRVYGMLQSEGLINAESGRGTTVREKPVIIYNRKEKALKAIDEMLAKMQSYGFTEAEAKIYFDLRLQQRSEDGRAVRLMVAANAPEEFEAINQACRTIANVETVSLSVQDLLHNPKRLNYKPDYIVYPAYLEKKLALLNLSSKEKLPVSFMTTDAAKRQILCIPKNKRLGVMAYEQNFLELVVKYLANLTNDELYFNKRVLDKSEATRDFIARQDILIISQPRLEVGNQRLSTAEMKYLYPDKQFILFEFVCDSGSELYLRKTVENRLSELKAE